MRSLLIIAVIVVALWLLYSPAGAAAGAGTGGSSPFDLFRSFVQGLRQNANADRIQSGGAKDTFLGLFGPNASVTQSFNDWVNSNFSYQTQNPWTGTSTTPVFGQSSPLDASVQNPFGTWGGSPLFDPFGPGGVFTRQIQRK